MPGGSFGKVPGRNMVAQWYRSVLPVTGPLRNHPSDAPSGIRHVTVVAGNHVQVQVIDGLAGWGPGARDRR